MTAPKIDFTARDWDSIMLALKTHLQNKFPNTWRSFYEADLGTAWMELVAYVFTILSYYLDVQANNTYLPTAMDRLSVINICKLIGYKLRQPTAASVTVTATIEGGAKLNPVILPALTSIQTIDGVPFLTLAQQTIPVGNATYDLTFTQGERKTENFISDGSTFQKFTVSQPNAVDGSVEMAVDGTDWTETASLIYATATSEYFTVEHDEDGYATVETGDGDNGRVPPAGSTVAVTYRVGGGIQGNIGLELVNTSTSAAYEVAPGNPAVTLTLLNDTYRGSGGEEAETLEHARYWAPRWAATNGRAVTEQDFDTLATAFSDPTHGGFAFAKAMLRQEIPELNTVDIYTWARDGSGSITEPSAALKTALETYFNNNGEDAIRIICTDVEVQDGNIVYVDLDISVEEESQYATSAVHTDVIAELDDLFESSSNQPGESFRLSRVYDAVQDSLGVEHALVNQMTASYKEEETWETGGGAAVYSLAANSLVDMEPNLPIVPSTITITANPGVAQQVVTDDGSGNLIGAVNPLGTNTIDYDTGAIEVTFQNVVPVAADIDIEYRRVIDYERSGVETTSTGSANFIGSVDYPPIVAYDSVSGTKGIAFTDGTRVVRDDGSGNLIGDVDAAGANWVDYDSGAYNFTFSAAAVAGTSIYSTYKQKLQTPSEDIPVDKTQLCVKGTYSLD